MQPPPLSLLASFYRGGTSRGLFLAPRTLAPFHPATRDALLCAALGSPDPDGRQIGGLGGGVSSLSKVAIVGPPDAALAARLRALGAGWALPGVEHADDEARARGGGAPHGDGGWDVVYRFGQVPVTGARVVDWSSTCGNLVAAVAQYAVDSGAVAQATLEECYERHLRERGGRDDAGQVQGQGQGQQERHHAFTFPVRILAADSGKRVLARLPIAVADGPGRGPRGRLYYPARSGEAAIAGVPGTAAGILIESPLEGSVLPTGRARDVVSLDGGDQVELTLISTGLPTIFIDASAISPSVERSALLAHPSALDAHPTLHPRLESIRRAAAHQLLNGALSPSVPKICIVLPASKGLAYETTAGGASRVHAEDVDLVIRPVSVGNFHRTVPATTLSALAAGSVMEESTIAQAVRAGVRASNASRTSSPASESVRTLTVGHCAGTASASVRVGPPSAKDAAAGLSTRPEAIVYVRTARRIMHGWVDLPALHSPLDDAPSAGSATTSQPGWNWMPDEAWYRSPGRDAAAKLLPRSRDEALRALAVTAPSLPPSDVLHWNGSILQD